VVIAYKEMRGIEAVINRRRGEAGRRSDIPLTNFRGIELRDFPAEIARLALIIAEFQCDVLCHGQKEALAEFLPLDAENWITCGKALRLDWLGVCPPTGTGVKYHADDLFHTPLGHLEEPCFTMLIRPVSGPARDFGAVEGGRSLASSQAAGVG
jgi:hypothetical protein